MANRTRQRAQLQAQRLAAAKKARRRRRVVWGVCLVIVAVAIGLIVWLLARDRTTPDPSPTGGTASVAPITPPDASDQGLGILANPQADAAAHQLVIYGDYQCSACAFYELALEPVLQEAAASDQVSLELRQRDFLDEDSLHDNWSRPASIASACADTVGAFFDYHMAIYQHFGQLDDTVLRDTIPQQLGLSTANLAAFQQCYDNQATAAFVDQMESQGAADMYNAGLTGTPAFVLDGVSVNLTQWVDNDGTAHLDTVRRDLGLV
ncbi:MAG: DsbA family protein [Propionibacteriaceae bacterium]|jgi:protein-disulfide isomerase|nr:DsbA family protein [Propionibacteriaceae bacterium]